MAPTLNRRRRPLLIVWVVFGLLFAGVLVFGGVSPPTGPTGERGPVGRLVAAPIDDIGAAEIVSAGAYYRFERDDEGRWFHHAHSRGADTAPHGHVAGQETSDAIMDGLAAFAAAPVTDDPGLVDDPASYGVVAPRLFVVFYRPGEDRPLARYMVGHRTANERRRYVAAAGSNVVVTIPEEAATAMLAMIDDVRR